MKKCSKCGEGYALDNFYRDRSRGDGLDARCKPCANIAVKMYRKKNPEKSVGSQKKTRLKSRYGLTECEYQEILDGQENLCKICKTPRGWKALSVDHCHKSGNVRGILCNSCNTGLGMFRDTPEFLLSAAEYLTTHQAELSGSARL